MKAFSIRLQNRKDALDVLYIIFIVKDISKLQDYIKLNYPDYYVDRMQEAAGDLIEVVDGKLEFFEEVPKNESDENLDATDETHVQMP
jgi:hypothetical protein